MLDLERVGGLGGRIKGFITVITDRLGQSTQETPLTYYQTRHSVHAVIDHFPQITAKDLLPLAAQSLDPLGKHTHEFAAEYGGQSQHDRMCLAIARGWAKEYADHSPETSSRLLQEIEQLTSSQAA